MQSGSQAWATPCRGILDGALAGSLSVGSSRFRLRAARAMLWSGALWFAALMVFGQTTTLSVGVPLLFATGFAELLPYPARRRHAAFLR